jgi:hypothetical protein
MMKLLMSPRVLHSSRRQKLFDRMMQKSAVHVPRAVRTESGIEFIKPCDKCRRCSHQEECQIWLEAWDMLACKYESGAASKR